MNSKYDASYNDANRPTCKVVKHAGQKGAWIFLRGCKVRTLADQQGEDNDHFSTQGKRKMTVTTMRRDYTTFLAHDLPFDHQATLV